MRGKKKDVKMITVVGKKAEQKKSGKENKQHLVVGKHYEVTELVGKDLIKNGQARKK